MTTVDYYEQRRLEVLARFENDRAARMAALEAALLAVRDCDDDVLDDEQRRTLRAAAAVVADLRQTW